MPKTLIADRLIRLAMSNDLALVLPPDRAQPFALPQFPMSQVIWLEHLTGMFMCDRKRCLSIALMMDLTQRTWVRSEVPTQQCRVDGVNWSWRAEDFAGRDPNLIIGGSFQSAVSSNIHEAMSLVPPTDGVHFVIVPGEHPCLYAFLHVGGQTLAVDPTKLVIDDVSAALAACTDRLKLD